MNQEIYEIFKKLHLKYDVIFEKELMDLIVNTKCKDDIYKIHQYLDSINTFKKGRAINKLITNLKNELKKF